MSKSPTKQLADNFYPFESEFENKNELSVHGHEFCSLKFVYAAIL